MPRERVGKSVDLTLKLSILEYSQEKGLGVARTKFGTAEAAKRLGVSRQTLLRWFSEGRIADDVKRDHRNWREFEERDIGRIRKSVYGG